MTSTELTTRKAELSKKREAAVQNVHNIDGAIAILNELIEKTKAEEAQAEAFKAEIASKLKVVPKPKRK